MRYLVYPLACNVDVPHSNIAVIWTPICEWYVVRCRSKNEHQNDMCLEEIELRSQNMLIILESIVNIIGGGYLYIRFMSTRIFTLIMNEIFIGGPNITR